MSAALEAVPDRYGARDQMRAEQARGHVANALEARLVAAITDQNVSLGGFIRFYFNPTEKWRSFRRAAGDVC